MTTPPEPHKPAFPVRGWAGGDTNPWIVGMWFVTVPVALAGIILTSSNLDPEEFDFDPIAANIGHSLLIVAGVLLASTLTAGAINWQLRRGPGSGSATRPATRVSCGNPSR